MLRHAVVPMQAEDPTACVPSMVAPPPSPEHERTAADRDVDLIVVGKHGQGWVESVTIGSTAAALCEIARRPVLMVPRRNNEA